MGLFNKKNRGVDKLKSKNFEDVFFIPTTQYGEQISLEEMLEKAKNIHALSKLSDKESRDNLFQILRYDDRGEFAIHASMSLAVRSDREEIIRFIRKNYKKIPQIGETGRLTNLAPNRCLPRMRLLYPLAWMREDNLINKLENKASPGIWAHFNLGDTIAEKNYNNAKDMIIAECLATEGMRKVMELTTDLYPQLQLDKKLLSDGLWGSVHRQPDPPNLHIGMTFDSVRSLLGKPYASRAEGNVRLYGIISMAGASGGGELPPNIAEKVEYVWHKEYGEYRLLFKDSYLYKIINAPKKNVYRWSKK